MPKQFQSVCGKPVLCYALEKFEQCSKVDEIVVVAAKDWLAHISQEIVDRFGFKKVQKLVAGGEKRQDSVWRGIEALNGTPDLVAVHDAARPFVTVEKISETIDACQRYSAAILAVHPKDTIKIDAAGFVDQTPPRQTLWCVQTPQVFAYELLKEAYLKAHESGMYDTDDSALVERLGHSVKIVEGEYNNIKITVPGDLELAELILKNKQLRCA